MKTFLFKTTRETKVWRKGQKVWATWLTGACAAPAIGKYKGKGRWVKHWVHWADDPLKPTKHYTGMLANAKWLGRKEITGKLEEIIMKFQKMNKLV